MKSPNEVSNWMQYMFAAVRRETGHKWNQPQYQIGIWTKQLKRLSADGVNPYLLALGIDLLALRWGYVKSENIWEVTTPGYLLKPFRDVGFPIWFWKGIWWSRFATTKPEQKYYRHWIRQAQNALTQGISLSAMHEAKMKLRDAESKLRERENSATFKVHWLENWEDSWS